MYIGLEIRPRLREEFSMNLNMPVERIVHFGSKRTDAS